MEGDTLFACRLCHHPDSRVVQAGIRDWEYGVEGVYAYHRCERCACVQLHPFPTTEDLKRAYDIDYHGYREAVKKGFLFNLLYSTKERLLGRRFKRLLRPGSKVLDVGCGAGEFLQLVRDLGAPDLEGIDFNPTAVELVERKGIKAFCGLFMDFEAAPGSYDLISMNNYLEHTLNPREELEKAYAFLKPGALLVGEVPGYDSYERRLFKQYWGGNHVPRHTFQFEQDFLRQLATEVGFTEVEITHELNTGHWALSVQNFMQRGRPDLRQNPSIRHGRAPYYVPLLFLFVPLNLPCKWLRKAGVTKFFLRK